LDNPINSEEDCPTDNEYDIEQNNGSMDPERRQQPDVRAAPNVPRLVRSTRESKRQAEKLLVTVNATETWRNKGGKKK